MPSSTATNRAPGSAKWEALGTTVVLRTSDPDALPAAQEAVELELACIDRACSRFRADSDLSHANARAGRWTHTGPVLVQALEVALRAAALTGGDVDPTVGRALELAGYDRDWRLLDEPGEGDRPPAPVITARARRRWREVDLDHASSAIRVPAGVILDLGATAKAWAADRAAGAARRATSSSALVSVGGDIATAGSGPSGGWKVRVSDDHRDPLSAPGQTVSIRSGGLATSSTAVRRWSSEGCEMHHIIDPHTGAPVLETWRTVSVAAATCTDANIATTAALVRAGAAPEWLEGMGLPARLVAEDGEVITVGAWPAREARA
jgi:FAD:protein FMN transferase